MQGKRVEEALLERAPTASTALDALTVARHRSFTGNIEAWTVPVAQFLKQNGFAAPAQ